MRWRTLRLIALSFGLCACLAYLCACGSDRPRTVDPDPSGEILWSTDPVAIAKEEMSFATIDTIWADRHDGYDRLVIAFEEATIPGYRAEYLRGPAMHCGSGNAVTTDGTDVLELRIEPARGYDERGASTVRHEERKLTLPGIQEVEVTCDFEAVFTLAVGVRDLLPFRIQELSDPARIVLDVRTSTG